MKITDRRMNRSSELPFILIPNGMFFYGVFGYGHPEKRLFYKASSSTLCAMSPPDVYSDRTSEHIIKDYEPVNVELVIY